MKFIEQLIYWLFPAHGTCDDVPDSRARPPHFHVPTGMEFDSGEDMLQK
jgi:hypothetical protein